MRDWSATWPVPQGQASGESGAPEEERSEVASPVVEPATNSVSDSRPQSWPQSTDEDAENLLTPLDYMLRVMRDPAVDVERRDEMAKLTLPYLHRKPAGAEPAEKDGRLGDEGLSLLEVGRRIAFALAAVSRAERKED